MKSIGESRLHTRFPWATQVADEDKSGFITLSVDDAKMAFFDFFEFCLMSCKITPSVKSLINIL